MKTRRAAETEVLRRAEQPPDRHELWGRPLHRRRLSATGRAGRYRLAVARGDLGDGAGAAAVSEPAAPAESQRPKPDWAEIHQEMRRKGVTLMLLWQEYQERHPGHGLPVQSVRQPLPPVAWARWTW